MAMYGCILSVAHLAPWGGVSAICGVWLYVWYIHGLVLYIVIIIEKI